MLSSMPTSFMPMALTARILTMYTNCHRFSTYFLFIKGARILTMYTYCHRLFTRLIAMPCCFPFLLFPHITHIHKHRNRHSILQEPRNLPEPFSILSKPQRSISDRCQLSRASLWSSAAKHNWGFNHPPQRILGLTWTTLPEVSREAEKFQDPASLNTSSPTHARSGHLLPEEHQDLKTPKRK